MISNFESLGSIVGAVAGVGLLFAAAAGLGRMVTGWRRGHWLLQVVVGLNLVGAVGVALGCAKLLEGGRSVWLLMALAALAVPAIWRTRSLRPFSFGRRRWLVIPTVLLALITLGPALCYPTGWDEMVYHHELPKRWLADGWPAFYADIPYSGFPSLGEILFWLIGPIEHAIAPRLVVWVCWMIGLAMVFRLLRRRLEIYAAATLTTAFALSGAVLMISANCYVESILLMNVAALLLVLESRERELAVAPWRKAVIVGVLVGGAAAVKLTGLAIALAPCIWCGVEVYVRRSRARMAAMSLCIALFVAAIVSLPFYVRPWLLAGNPFYPYYEAWFSADPARLEMSRYHHELGAAFGMRDASSFVTAPLLLALDANATLYDGTFGWQLLAMVFLAVLAIGGVGQLRVRPYVLKYAATAGWLYVFWYFTAQQARFAIPALTGLLLLSTIGLRRLHNSRRKLALAVMLAVTFISLPWRTAGHYLGSWMTAIGIVKRADYVDVSTRDVATPEEAKKPVYYPLIVALHEHTPRDAKLMVLFEHRGFYFPRRFEIGTPFFQEAGFTPPEQFTDAERLMKRLRERQISHVVVTNAPAGPDQVPGWFDRFEHFLPMFGECAKQGKLRVVWNSERYILLEVQP